MKKLLVLMLAGLLLTGIAFAEGLDYTAMSEADLQAIITSTRNELVRRDCVLSDETVFLDSENCKVYRDSGKEIYFNNGSLRIPVILVSEAPEEVSFQFDSVLVNGWDCSGMIGNISAAGKKRDELKINCAGAEVSQVEEIEDIKMVVIAFNMGTFQREGESEPLTFVLNQ